MADEESTLPAMPDASKPLLVLANRVRLQDYTLFAHASSIAKQKIENRCGSNNMSSLLIA